MKKTVTVLLLVIVLGGIAILSVIRAREALAAKAARAQRSTETPPVVVNMVMPEKRTLLDERTFSGTTRAWSSYDVEPKVSGKLLKLTVDIDSVLHKGDLIAKIDDDEYVQALNQAEANLELARAQHDEAKIMIELRESEYKRQLELKQAGATSQAEFDKAESTIKAQRAIEKMRGAEVRRHEALVANAKLKLADCTISANWENGSDVRYIGERYLDEGTLLQVGKPIVQIIEIDRLKVYIPVIERDYRYLHEGQDVAISVDAKPGKTFAGKVSNVANSLSENTRNAWVVISVPNEKLELRPGMFARASVVLAVHKDATVIPVDAVLTRDGKVGIYVCNTANKTAHFVPIRTGLSADRWIEVVEPAQLENPVITVGNHLLHEGSAVDISELSRTEILKKRYEKAGQDSAKPAEK